MILVYTGSKCTEGVAGVKKIVFEGKAVEIDVDGYSFGDVGENFTLTDLIASMDGMDVKVTVEIKEEDVPKVIERIRETITYKTSTLPRRIPSVAERNVREIKAASDMVGKLREVDYQDTGDDLDGYSIGGYKDNY